VIPKLSFGKTGHNSTRTVFGGAAIREGFTPQSADRLLEMLLEYGVNHIDTAPLYGNGNSEACIGSWMKKTYRDRFFLATKIGQRSYREALHSIRTSLNNLRVEYIDLIQLHNLTDPEEWRLALEPNGALQACIEAREHGLVRFIGVTGHGLFAPRMHMKSLERFPFDAVLLPWNYPLSKHAEYAGDFSRLKNLCAKLQVAVQTIKSVALRPWEGRMRSADTWYEPLTLQDDIGRAVSWLLSHEGIFLNTVGDATTLPQVLAAANDPIPRPSDSQMEMMMATRGMKLIFSGNNMVT
jgi:aryl-alcohol dehydrogenase-like predicted oxidoreductase